MFRDSRVALLGFVALVLGTALGYWWGNIGDTSLQDSLKNSLAPIQQKDSALTLIRPLLAYRTPEATKYGEYTDLKAALQADVADAEQSTGVTRVGLYFRDLDTARWVGINQDDTYHPASLLKVPLMIAYYKEAETNPALLKEEVTYHTYSNLPPFEAASQLVVGKTYTVEELIGHMITQSDNGATFTLLDQINPDVLSATYLALGIPEPGEGSTDYKISARTYGLFFRILYNATYLSPEYSQKALEILSHADFAGGLRAGLPKDTLAAQKYGEHVLATGTSVNGVELSDCGVVYYPGHPYLICVMASAEDEVTASNAISTISTTAYNAIKTQYSQ